MELLSSVLDHIARDEPRGRSAARFFKAWMRIRLLELLGHVAYGSHPRQRLDLYRPHQTSGKCRLVVFLYGGCWTTGARRRYRFLAHASGSRGFAVAIPDYRLFPDANFPDFLVDTASAIGWLHRSTRSSGSTARSSVGPTSLASSPTKRPSPGWSGHAFSSKAMRGPCSVPVA